MHTVPAAAPLDLVTNNRLRFADGRNPREFRRSSRNALRTCTYIMLRFFFPPRFRSTGIDVTATTRRRRRRRYHHDCATIIIICTMADYYHCTATRLGIVVGVIAPLQWPTQYPSSLSQ